MSRDFSVDVPLLSVRQKPDDVAEGTNQLLYGEGVSILNDNGFWGMAKSDHDGYQGHVHLNRLRLHKDKTHKVFVPSTHIYDVPNFKFTPRSTLYFLSQVHVTVEKQNGFVKLGNGGWVYEAHLAPIDFTHPDITGIAMTFLNAPYLWGGRSVAGVDCSGLVQVVLMAAGVPCPRDSGQQSEAIGTAVNNPQRGDFVFFEGHVGIMIDDSRILNATSRHMRTIIELLSEVESAYEGGIKAIRRI
jgi:cell wall-associated NlpC family hydrolase